MLSSGTPTVHITRCCQCGRKLVVSDAVKRQLDTNTGTAVLCEKCAMVWPQADVNAAKETEPKAANPMEVSATCMALKEQHKAAVRDWARLSHLPDESEAKTAYRRLAHVSDARSKHRFKAHNSEPRGRE
jgi:hypothetical protein